MIGTFHLDHVSASGTHEAQPTRTPHRPAERPPRPRKNGASTLALKPSDIIPMPGEHVPGVF
jgi:hypothetical protein